MDSIRGQTFDLFNVESIFFGLEKYTVRRMSVQVVQAMDLGLCWQVQSLGCYRQFQPPYNLKLNFSQLCASPS